MVSSITNNIGTAVSSQAAGVTNTNQGQKPTEHLNPAQVQHLVAQTSQVAAEEAATKLGLEDKKRMPQVKKRTEGAFAEHDQNEQGEQESKESEKPGDPKAPGGHHLNVRV